MAISSTFWTLFAVAIVIVAAAPAATETTAFTRSDITGNDIDCGQGKPACRVCGDVNSLESSCRANPTCKAFTFDNSCGYLKTAGSPRTYREGYSAFILAADNSTTPQPAAAAAASNSTPTPPSPSPPAAAAPPKDTVQVSAPAPTAPATAAAAGGGGGGGGCTLAAWAQCGGQGGDCASGKPGYKCADAPYSGCACPADNPCQRKDAFFYQCAPPNYKFPPNSGPQPPAAQQAETAAPTSPPASPPAAGAAPASAPVSSASQGLPATANFPPFPSFTSLPGLQTPVNTGRKLKL